MWVRLAWMGSMIVVFGVCAAGRGVRAEGADAPMPANIHVPDELRPVIGEMLAASPTFRRQWAAVAHGGRVHVAVFLTRGPLATGIRAETVMRRYASGLLLAVVQIPPGGDLVELLAHEFEHIVEQMEGIDLASLARRGSIDVRRRDDGSFETSRARNAGLAVAAEVRLALRPE